MTDANAQSVVVAVGRPLLNHDVDADPDQRIHAIMVFSGPTALGHTGSTPCKARLSRALCLDLRLPLLIDGEGALLEGEQIHFGLSQWCAGHSITLLSLVWL